MHYIKSKTNQLHTPYLEFNLIILSFDVSLFVLLCFIVLLKFMIAGKTFLDYINLFSLNDYQKNNKILRKRFKNKYDKRKCKP